MNDPSLTFVVPAFNAASTVADTVRSLITQTRSDWRAVVVDDGSTDATASIVRSFKDTRIELVTQPNAGLAGARNTGWRRVTTPAVAFIDADDVIDPRYAQVMLPALNGHDLAACSHSFVGPRLEFLAWSVPFDPHAVVLDRLVDVNPLAIGAVVFDRNVLARVAFTDGPFDSSRRRIEDWDLWLRLVSTGVRWAPPIHESLYSYRLRHGALSSQISLMWRDALELVSRWSPATRRDASRRGATLRHLARAVVARDAGSFEAMKTELAPITFEDTPILTGAFRWAFCFHEQIGPSEAATRTAEYAELIRAAIHPPGVADAVIRRLSWSDDRWRAAADRAVAARRPGERLVVFGLGRNGRECAITLDSLGVEYVGSDDRPQASPAFEFVRPEDLTDRDVVLVTPENHAGIVSRLSERRITRIFTAA